MVKLSRTMGLAGALAVAVLATAVAVVTLETTASTPADAAIVESRLFDKPVPIGEGCYRIPAIIRTKANTLLAFAEDRIDSCADDGHIDLVMRRSTDNGRSWSSIRMVLQGTDADPNAPATRGNPVPILDRDTGRIVLLSTFNPGTTARPRTPYVQYSDDDGLTWSTARSLLGVIDDPTWGWYATGPSHGIQLTRGAHAGRLVAGVNFSDGSGRNGAALVYSDDSGVTWHRGATDIRPTTNIVPQELSLFERTNGGIYALARDQNGTNAGNRAYAVSNDGGATFAAPFASISGLVTPVVQGSTLRLRATDEGDRYNRVLFASPADPTLRKRMTIWSSYDEGGSWTTTTPKQITADRSGYSDLAELATGEIGLLYEAGEEAGDARDEIRFTRLTETDLGLPDGPAGPTTPDLSGLHNDAYLRNGPTTVAGRFGNALSLDGVNDHIQLPYAESLALGAGDFTAMTWIRYAPSTANQAIFWGYNMGDVYSQFWLRAEPGSNRIRGWVQNRENSASVSSTQAYDDNAWHHVALQRVAGQLKLWVDGAVVATVAAPSGSVSPGRPFKMYVGQRLDGAHRFKGQFDEVRIYKRALTATEITAIRSSNATTAANAVLRLPL